MAAKNFVVLIGGPGTFHTKDRVHDTSWSNYLVPMQLAAERNWYKLAGETVHWVVFKPAYENRWLDDRQVTFHEWWVKFTEGDHWLNQSRLDRAKEASRKKGPDGRAAWSYWGRIEQIARQHGIKLTGISSPNEFWNYLRGLPDRSISRVWYCGHATRGALMLDINHNNLPNVGSNHTITVDQIDTEKDLDIKFIVDTPQSSAFYGCNTALFAEKWNYWYGVPAEGANNKITFKVIDAPGTGTVLERLRTQPTDAGPPNWQKFVPPT